MAQLRELSAPIRAVLLASALLVFGLLFRELATLLVAVLITVVLAIPLAAAATALERWRVPRWLGALVALLAGLGVIAGVLALVTPPFIDEMQRFIDRLPAIIDQLRGQVKALGGEGTGTEIRSFLEGYVDDPERLIGPLASIGLSIAGILAGIVLIVITAYYIAVRPQPLLDGILALFPPDRRGWAKNLIERLRSSWIGWLQGVVVDMLVTGTLLYIGLTALGLDFAVFFAVFSGLLVVIPYFGAIVGAVPPVLFALTEGVDVAAAALAIYIVVQQIEANVTIPLVMANRVQLHPAVVAVGVVIVGQLFGFVGLFVAVPILSTIVIAVDELWVKPVAGGRGVEPVGERELASRTQARGEAERPPPRPRIPT